MKYTAEKVRARFERFASDYGKWPGAVVRSGDAYKLMNTHIQWVAWQAAYADSIERTQPADSGQVTDDRAAFEQWVSKRHAVALDRWADSGKYRYDNTNAWWECWQAALAVQGQGGVYQCPECGTGMQVDPTAKPAPPAGVPEGWLIEARRLYDKVKAFPEKNGDPMTVGGTGFMQLLELRNHVENLLSAAPQPGESA